MNNLTTFELNNRNSIVANCFKHIEHLINDMLEASSNFSQVFDGSKNQSLPFDTLKNAVDEFKNNSSQDSSKKPFNTHPGFGVFSGKVQLQPTTNPDILNL